MSRSVSPHRAKRGASDVSRSLGDQLLVYADIGSARRRSLRRIWLSILNFIDKKLECICCQKGIGPVAKQRLYTPKKPMQNFFYFLKCARR